jgi:small conductance mechanosensitive channel
MMTQLIDQLQQLGIDYGLNLVGSILILFIGRWAAKLITKGLMRLMERGRIDQTLLSFFNNLAFYLLMLLVIVAALGNLGFETTSLIAILGGATLAIGFALQDSLGNIAAGVMIILLRPYRINDFIGVEDEVGKVTDIKIFHTQVVTTKNKVILIPNNQILTNNIINYSEKELYRHDMVFGIGYGDDLLKAKQILLDILIDDPRIAQEPAPIVIVGELGDSSVNLVAQPWVDFSQHPKIEAAVTEQVKLRFDAENITIPFPQRDVHLFQTG